MAFFKKPLLRGPGCTFACGFATAAFQLVIALLLGADSFVFSDFYALALPLLLFVSAGWFFMRGLSCKTLLLSALLLDAIILLADGLEALLAMQGITPYVTYIFTLWPFSYFSTPVSLVTVRLGLAPPGAASYLLPLLPPLLFAVFGLFAKSDHTAGS
ncbi:MAG TPA: hypothetical protein H9739_06065 [Candidatus Agathobaculum pullistercoris]|nr:hypothetical protein [uncultured Agathobaculum sp.]HIX11134.1 hypothetical protein [Candidatus Agathobaculum pullistercoris]